MPNEREKEIMAEDLGGCRWRHHAHKTPGGDLSSLVMTKLFTGY